MQLILAVAIAAAIAAVASTTVATTFLKYCFTYCVVCCIAAVLISYAFVSCCNYELSATVKPHLVATLFIRPPCYSGQVQKVQMYLPYYFIDFIFVNRATSLIRQCSK